MELSQGIITRKSIRAFKPTPISRETMDRVLEMACNSPSYSNSQPWEVAVVGGKKKDELSKILYKMAKSNVPVNHDMPSPQNWPPELDKRVKDQGARRLTALGVARDDKQKREELRLLNYTFYGAPAMIFVFIEKGLTPWSVFDAGLFVQTLLLAAHSFGLGTCLQASTVGYADTIRKFLGIPENKMFVIGFPIGYPDTKAELNAFQSLKLSPRDFVRWYD